MHHKYQIFPFRRFLSGTIGFAAWRLMSKVHLNLFFILVGFVFLLSGCIKYYEPVFEENDIHKLVVNGLIANQDGYQYVYVSTTSALNKPAENPVSNCQVLVEKNNGNPYQFTEFEPGKYRIWTNSSDFLPGDQFRLIITTPDGEIIQSDFDSLISQVTIDSVYFSTFIKPTSDPGHPLVGIQFFINIDARNASAEFFKWDLIETWEKHAPLPIIWWYDGHIHKQDPPDYSKNLCYQTELIGDIFTLTTRSLDPKVFKGFHLHSVDTRSQRLSYLYSLLIRQYSITQTTYDYWERLKKNLEQRDGLYTSQPISVVGNLQNITNPEKVVLGNFAVVGVSEKRIFVKDPPGIITDFEPCSSGSLRFGLRDISPYDYPAYLDGNEFNYFNTQLSPGCVDCTRDGGTTVKPDFWP